MIVCSLRGVTWFYFSKISYFFKMRKCAHEALLALQTSCPGEFEALLESLPPTTSETARYLLSTSQ